MNILTLISGGDIGGAKTHVLTLLRELSKTDKVCMVCFTEGEFAADARKMGIDTRIISNRSPLQDLKELKKLIDSEGFDVIHSHGARGNFMAALLKRHARLPLLTTVHSDPKLDYMGRPAARMTYGVINGFALKKMDYLTGVSASMRELLTSRGFAPDKLFTIYNGVEMKTAEDLPSRREFYAAHGINFPTDSINVGIAARLNPVKDIATLIRGFAIAEKTEPRLRLLIAGEGPEEEMLRGLAKELGVEDKVAFLGWISDTDAFYSCLDINTLTSVSETFPYALTEGARYTLATVSSRVGGVPALIDHGVNGMLFLPGDYEKLGEALSMLALNEGVRKQMARKLREKVSEEFSLEATCRTQREIYETILRRTKTKRKNVVICGAYGRGNSGDEAILRSVINEVREVSPDAVITVLSVNPRETRYIHGVRSVFSFNVLSFARLCMKADLYINGGGSLIQDVTSRRSLWFYLFTLRCAHRHGVPVLMYGCGIGPVNRPYNRRLAGRIINENVDCITLREDGSMTELADMGVVKPEIYPAADPSLLLPAAGDTAVNSFMLTEGLDPKGKYIGFALRYWDGFVDKAADIAAAADFAYEKYGLTPVFIPISNVSDAKAAADVVQQMKAPAHIIERAMESDIVIGLMSRMSAVVSMRLHGLIFAAGHGVPLVGIVYDPKVSSFLDYLGFEHYVDLSEVSADKLRALISAAVAEFSPEAREAAISRLVEKEKVNRDILAEFLK
ncbi:MAG: polysaccharide pyruvyl transferase CsaB [Oscillospiraceae bacterium]|nr:polysaccharide pyruvyl transferase CsaB [Oscillospiraceae bacterium]